MSDTFNRYVRHNLGLKLMALALAVGLWLAVSRDPVDEIPVNVAVEFHRIPENLELATENIPQAQILVRGPERLMHRLQQSDVHVEVDLLGAKPGERTIDLSAHQIHLPRDLEVVQIIPSQLHLAFDMRATRQIAINPRVIGTLAPNRKIAEIQVNPPQITITGPQQRVAAVQEAVTDPVDASGTIKQNTFVTHAYVADPLVQVVHPEPVRVTVIMEDVAPGH